MDKFTWLTTVRTFQNKTTWLGRDFCSRGTIEQRLFSSGPNHIERRIYVKGLCLRNFPVTIEMTKVAEPVSLLQASESTKKVSRLFFDVLDLTSAIWNAVCWNENLVIKNVASTNFVSNSFRLNFLRHFLVGPAGVSDTVEVTIFVSIFVDHILS